MTSTAMRVEGGSLYREFRHVGVVQGHSGVLKAILQEHLKTNTGLASRILLSLARG